MLLLLLELMRKRGYLSNCGLIFSPLLVASKLLPAALQLLPAALQKQGKQGRPERTKIFKFFKEPTRY